MSYKKIKRVEIDPLYWLQMLTKWLLVPLNVAELASFGRRAVFTLGLNDIAVLVGPDGVSAGENKLLSAFVIVGFGCAADLSQDHVPDGLVERTTDNVFVVEVTCNSSATGAGDDLLGTLFVNNDRAFAGRVALTICDRSLDTSIVIVIVEGINPLRTRVVVGQIVIFIALDFVLHRIPGYIRLCRKDCSQDRRAKYGQPKLTQSIHQNSSAGDSRSNLSPLRVRGGNDPPLWAGVCPTILLTKAKF